MNVRQNRQNRTRRIRRIAHSLIPRLELNTPMQTRSGLASAIAQWSSGTGSNRNRNRRTGTGTGSRTGRTADQRRAELLAQPLTFSLLRVTTSRGRVHAGLTGLGFDRGPLTGARAEIAMPATPPNGGTVLALALLGRARIGRPGRAMITFRDGSYLERSFTWMASGRVAAEIARFNATASAGQPQPGA